MRLKQHMRLSKVGAQLYLCISHVTLMSGALSWDEYLPRLRFIRDCGEPGTLEVRTAAKILRDQEFEDDDEHPGGETEPKAPPEGPGESRLSMEKDQQPLEPPLVKFIAAFTTGLHAWHFHQADADFFPSIPHGHWQTDQRRKLDTYRGWVYRGDKQIGREPRWKIVALWNDEKFRSFASIAIQYYMISFPCYRWAVQNPQRLPRRRGK